MAKARGGRSAVDREQRRDFDLVRVNAVAILRSLLEWQTPPGDTRPSLDLPLSVEACLLAAAALIESSRQGAAHASVRQAGANLGAYVDDFRRERMISGESALEQLDAVGARTASTH
jgi:hypothetical protein